MNPQWTGSFVAGANLPWFRYGCDFGASAWFPEGGVAAPGTRQQVGEQLARLAAAGCQSVRWFMLCDGRSGILFDRGVPLGLDEHLMADLDAALALLDKTGLRVIFTLFDHTWFSSSTECRGVQMGGRGAVVADPVSRARLLETVVAPILEHAGSHPAVGAWDIINEPEWATRRFAAVRWRGRVGRSIMREFVAEAVAMIHQLTPQPVTVGSACARWLPFVRDLGLDFYQVHWYDHLERKSPLHVPVSAYELDRPVILGEYPTRGSALAPREILDAAFEAGYQAAFGWSLNAADESSDARALTEALRRWPSERNARANVLRERAAPAGGAGPDTGRSRSGA